MGVIRVNLARPYRRENIERIKKEEQGMTWDKLLKYANFLF